MFAAGPAPGCRASFFCCRNTQRRTPPATAIRTSGQPATHRGAKPAEQLAEQPVQRAREHDGRQQHQHRGQQQVADGAHLQPRAIGLHGAGHAGGQHLCGGHRQQKVATGPARVKTNPARGPDGGGVQADHAYTLEAREEVQAVQVAQAVRRLTPVECERLMGFPDDYTLIPWRGKPAEECPDGPRYKAIGNSKAIPVVRWIGRRIQQQLDR